jgi:hypothetical protein
MILLNMKWLKSKVRAEIFKPITMKKRMKSMKKNVLVKKMMRLIQKKKV